ncbi:abscisic acid-insensitive 5-like protein 3 [Phtheirospermum japonicum]|uniref:Abscisic acid-insensitive 5-like protein 3 n=1 Tax=Phtheirospermum japonicum TaxID=374723 RepID=A0A830CDA8_9LAMI|nr:abscisic acid-insensitive 5-like protein 3 [Phtheirospermum japonicum]
MSVDELLNKVWTIEANQNDNITPSPAATLQLQASWSLARALSGKTVDEVWRDIQRGYKTRELTLGELTLEDFLVEAGMYVTNASIEPVMSLDSALRSHKYSSQMGFSPSRSIDELSDTPIPGRKRISGDFDKAIERRLRRKIKNRESAARSRARKQAYHNELATKVSCLEEEILKLKKEKASNTFPYSNEVNF